MAACAVMLLGACEHSNDQTPPGQTTPEVRDDSSTPKLREIDAATRERIETLKKRQDDRLNADPLETPTASPATEK